MNPIFQATSNHRYNISDYFKIDYKLGNLNDFSALLEIAHHNNIRVIIDGVFNHCGRGFFAFNDIMENHNHSPYIDWFHLKCKGEAKQKWKTMQCKREMKHRVKPCNAEVRHAKGKTKQKQQIMQRKRETKHRVKPCNAEVRQANGSKIGMIKPDLYPREDRSRKQCM